MHAQPTDLSVPTQNQTLFIIYSIYRVGIAVILLVLFFTTGLGSQSASLFLFTSALYLICNAIILALFLRNWQPSANALLVVITSDLVLLQLASWASGIVQSGLGVLLVVSVAAGSIFLKRNQVLLVPSFATITLLVNMSIGLLQQRVGTSDIVASGWLGITFFVTSITVRYLTARLQASEFIAERESANAKKLEQLNSLVIERMQTGIAVLNHQTEIVLCNNSGRKLLGASTNPSNKPLDKININVANAFNQWRKSSNLYHRNSFDSESPAIQSYASGPTIRLIFIRLEENDADSDFLMFIDDISKIQQHAQQLKLASLGQLTASIAHEIRNPLGAVSHAAQLLEESSNNEEDKKLTRIICQQATRCSTIIDSVLTVSRGNPSSIKRLDIVNWLPVFLDAYQIGKQCNIELELPSELDVSFDVNQLGQILTNLLDNGIRYSADATGKESIKLRCATDSNGLPYLDIIDSGAGVNEADIEHLFEPFFTTETTGSGLGLYICRELCEANQARISYVSHFQHSTNQKNANDHHCFRINFAHPDRKTFDVAQSIQSYNEENTPDEIISQSTNINMNTNKET